MSQHLFKYKHFESEIILLFVRWYLNYPLSYRMLIEMMQERGLKLTHTTIMRWVHQYSSIIDKRVCRAVKRSYSPPSQLAALNNSNNNPSPSRTIKLTEINPLPSS